MSEELIKRLREIIGRHVYLGSAVAVIDDIDRLMRELESRPAPAAQVVEGWKLVADAVCEEFDRLGTPDNRSILELVIKRALAAAPDTPVATDRAEKCSKCNGTGGERWHEADGSENGQKCDACDGFGNAAPVATEAVAQGGGVDVEKVMALVEELLCFHDDADGYACDEIRDQIRALLTAAPAIAHKEKD